jgi:hypothetical protein
MTSDYVSYLTKALNIIEKKVREMGGEIGCGIEMDVGPGPVHTATIHLIFQSDRLREYVSRLPGKLCDEGKSLSMDGVSEVFHE